MATRKSSREKLDEKLLQAAIMAVERLKQMIQDENSGNGDVIRASSLIFDRLPREGGPVQAVGDYEIVLKDGS